MRNKVCGGMGFEVWVKDKGVRNNGSGWVWKEVDAMR